DGQAERDREDRMAGARAREEEEHPADGDRSENGHHGGRLREEPERDPGVLNVVDREGPEHVVLAVERELARDDVLRQLVGVEGGERDRPQRDPLMRTRRERALGSGDRSEAVGRRPHPYVPRHRAASYWRGLAQLLRPWMARSREPWTRSVLNRAPPDAC